MKCKAGETLESGRCIGVPDVKLRGNTHLWIVNRSLDLLSKSSDPVARKAVQTMRSSGCASQWRKGLYDGDEPVHVDDPTQTKRATAGSHFYNPTGKDYYGKPTRAVTYLIGGVDVSTGGFRGVPNLNARQMADANIKKIPASGPTQGNSCYQFGLALHYLTDMTQPMHTSGYSGVSSPQFLHPYFEAYVPVIQTRFPARGAFRVSAVSRQSPDANFEITARKGNALAPALMRALIKDGAKCTLDGVDLSPIPYIGYCFINDGNVDRQVGVILQNAYTSTADYVYSVFNAVNNNGSNGGSNNTSVVRPTPKPLPPTSANNLELDCFNRVQGKIVWRQGGSKQWSAGNVTALCKATRNPKATVACFQRGISAHNSWQRATQDCRAK
jgi:hypothetical protein